MRAAASWTRWATCALALSICMPVAIADRGGGGAPRKSLASCTTFDQQDKDDDKVEFTIHNTCTVPIDCSISWRVVCAPESKKRRATHPGLAKLALANNTTQSTQASASVCGDAGWSIEAISWSCQPTAD